MSTPESLASRLSDAIADLFDAQHKRSVAGDSYSHYGHEHLNNECSKARDELANVLIDLKQWVNEP